MGAVMILDSCLLKFARKRIRSSVSQSVTKLFLGQPWQHGSFKEALIMDRNLSLKVIFQLSPMSIFNRPGVAGAVL
jgi:hypothetical protein